MNAEIPTPSVVTPAITEPPVIPASATAPSLRRRVAFAPVKFVLGMVFCQSVLGSLAILGWTYRLMQRAVLKQWWKLSEPARRGEGFAEFATGDSRTKEHRHWPNWFAAQNFRETVSSDDSTPGFGKRLRRVLKSLGESLWMNVRIGVQAIFNTWVFTLPGCVLMLFGWYDGWNNSFNKGYEQFSVGPSIGLLGVALFIAAMYYVPMAQARQAVTGQWRSFYQFHLVWTLIRRRWLACLGLAALYSLCSVPIMVLTAAVTSLPNINPKLADLTPAQTIQFLNRYYFWSAAFVLPAFVMLRLVAARIYGSAILKCVQSGVIAEDALAEGEWQALHRLDLLRVQPRPQRHPVWRVVAWAGTRAGRITCGVLTAMVWFAFLAQLFIAQFFNYRGAPGWLNQPLVQLPWFHHIPATLKNPWGDAIAATLVVFIAWRLSKLAVWLRSLRKR